MAGAKIELAFRALDLLVRMLDKLMPAVEKEIDEYKNNKSSSEEDIKSN